MENKVLLGATSYASIIFIVYFNVNESFYFYRMLKMEETTIDVISASIALGALIITLYQIHAIRKHNFLGVKPYLQFGWTAGTTGDGIWIKNVGLGPAIIENFTIIKNGAEIQSKELSDQLFNIGFDSRMVIISPGSIIQEKDQCWIVRPKEFIEDGKSQELFWNLLAGIEFNIEYKSFYDKFEPKIKWFAPNPINNIVRAKP